MHIFRKKKTRSCCNVLLNTKLPFVYTEAYKSLRTNIEFLSTADNAKKIFVTSALSGEGKTCFSINLAISLAQTGKKVIVVDCDLRKPKLQKYLRVKHTAQYGVSTVLGGAIELDSAIGYIESLNIYVLLAGIIPPNPSELLSSERSKAMFEKLSENFDYIICDTPPATVVTDAVSLSKNCDGAILVIRQNYATKPQIREVINKLETVGTKIFGAVLNNYNEHYDVLNYGSNKNGYYDCDKIL